MSRRARVLFIQRKKTEPFQQSWSESLFEKRSKKDWILNSDIKKKTFQNATKEVDKVGVAEGLQDVLGATKDARRKNEMVVLGNPFRCPASNCHKVWHRTINGMGGTLSQRIKCHESVFENNQFFLSNGNLETPLDEWIQDPAERWQNTGETKTILPWELWQKWPIYCWVFVNLMMLK